MNFYLSHGESGDFISRRNSLRSRAINDARLGPTLRVAANKKMRCNGEKWWHFALESDAPTFRVYHFVRVLKRCIFVEK